jgi:hypothetical protein
MWLRLYPHERAHEALCLIKLVRLFCYDSSQK